MLPPHTARRQVEDLLNLFKLPKWFGARGTTIATEHRFRRFLVLQLRHVRLLLEKRGRKSSRCDRLATTRRHKYVLLLLMLSVVKGRRERVLLLQLLLLCTGLWRVN